MVISYFYTEYRDDDAFIISILKIYMMMLLVFTYWRCRWWCTDEASASSRVWVEFKNEEGLYHPGTSVHNRSGDLGPRECGGIVSSLGTCPKVIQRPQSLRMKRDCIIPRHLSTIDPVTLVLENVVGLYHPWALALKWSGDLGLREWRGIVSSWDICS